MDSPEKFSNSKEVIAFLVESFPMCFSLEGEAKPLKIGIFQELAEALKDEKRLSKTLLRSSLRHYTSSWRYLHSVKEGSNRVDLKGDVAEVVEKEHADHALLQLKESKQKVAERRKQEAPKAKNVKKKDNFKQKGDNPTKLNGTSAQKSRPNKEVPQKLLPEQLVAGTEVTVKVGKVPMPAVITKVGKDGIQVQLQSGMQIKVQEDTLRLARAKRS
ncbi:RNA chaperone ProQ [Paraneptunicella aestuarii]|uniref:RNA chaperone ProQ n=1 Tax=Paraneptunicella aestuarii TaxID=2831148 RepID=UPI001E4BAA19|nr:RNA chaperone ProQ [Paraneptunicella aestuarii]UAA37157.1 RNA chaperone ProQ [Paraneptunicella aestuarii]